MYVRRPCSVGAADGAKLGACEGESLGGCEGRVMMHCARAPGEHSEPERAMQCDGAMLGACDPPRLRERRRTLRRS